MWHIYARLQGLGGVLRFGVMPAPDLQTVAKYPMSGNWPHNGYNKEVRCLLCCLHACAHWHALPLLSKAGMAF